MLRPVGGGEVTPLRYLSQEDVRGLLPPLDQQLDLVEMTLAEMEAGRTQLPPKPSIYPRSDSFLHAMPVYLESHDVAALKWIGASAGNKRRDLPYLSGLIVVNDPETMAPAAILDAKDITAARTAAVSGVCVRRLASRQPRTIAIVGYGVQGEAHARMFAETNPDAEIVIVSSTVPASGGDESLANRRPLQTAALQEADVVVTAIRLDRPPRPFLSADALASVDLVIPVDFDAAIEASAAHHGSALVTDHLETFGYYRSRGYFEGWPEPTCTLGEALAVGRRFAGAVCCNLGVATLDAAFAHVVLEQAVAKGIGRVLD